MATCMCKMRNQCLVMRICTRCIGGVTCYVCGGHTQCAAGSDRAMPYRTYDSMRLGQCEAGLASAGEGAQWRHVSLLVCLCECEFALLLLLVVWMWV